MRYILILLSTLPLLADVPASISCHIEENILVLRDADSGAEFARSAVPEALQGLSLEHIAHRGNDCWIGTNRGLLRVDLTKMTWSMLAIEGRYRDVPVDTLALTEKTLAVVHSGGQQASFDLASQRWITAKAKGQDKPPYLPMVLFLLMLLAGYFAVRQKFLGSDSQ